MGECCALRRKLFMLFVFMVMPVFMAGSWSGVSRLYCAAYLPIKNCARRVTIDHIYLPPSGGRVVISDDAGVVVVLPGLMITGLGHTNGRGHST